MSTSPTSVTGSARAALAELLADGSAVLKVAEHFRAGSHELYLVGGRVRDAFLGRPGGDLDFATDAPPERTLEVLRPLTASLWLQGLSYGTVGAEVDGLRMEITTFRSERYAPGSRHPRVSYESTIETDLSRRDFTINAVAVRLPEREAIDPCGGRADMGARLLRTPVDPNLSFTDDPLRMLRAFRFVSQLGFTIADDVLAAISRLGDSLSTVSAERTRDELDRLLLGAQPGEALRLAKATELSDVFLPELSALELEQDPVHRHKDVLAHTLAVVDRTEPVLELRLAALLHDVGKPKTRRIGAEGVSFHHHEVVGADIARARLRALRYPNDVVEPVTELIRLHHRFHTYRLGWTDSAVRRYVRDAGALLPLLNALVRADCTTRNRDKAERLARRMDELEARIGELAAKEELRAMRPELDGNEIMALLGIPPGPLVGEARRYLLDVRLDEGVIGKEEARRRLEEWARGRGLEPARPES